MSDDLASLTEPPEYQDPPLLSARHFLTCRGLWYDDQQPEQGHQLIGIYTTIKPPPGISFPFRLVLFFVYFQVFGDDALHRFRIRQVKLELNEDDEYEEVQLGRNGEPREFPEQNPIRVGVSDVEFVIEIGYQIGPVGFRDPGLYEFQLWAEGIQEPIARERVLAQEAIREQSI